MENEVVAIAFLGLQQRKAVKARIKSDPLRKQELLALQMGFIRTAVKMLHKEVLEFIEEK